MAFEAACKFFLLLSPHSSFKISPPPPSGPPTKRQTNTNTLLHSDIHIYYLQSNPSQTLFASQLHARIRHEFPELRIYKFWDKPVGPHPLAMFEVNVFTPAEFGAFVSWLVVNRGPLSALVHPNTVGDEGGEYRDQ
jgi:aromatic ring-cleaving dioxygenase